jgi:serine/threonine protein phosphatase PrpC
MYTGVVRANDGVFSDQIQGARERQEDAVTYRSFDDGESLLLVLADGMGGHQGGEIASRTSVDAFVSAFFTEWSHVKTSFRLFGSLNRANKDLEVIGKKNAELEGMGSTLLAAVLSRDGISWISVGDSLLLRVRAGKVKRLNEDHSMVPLLEEAVKKGKLTSEEAATHKDPRYRVLRLN